MGANKLITLIGGLVLVVAVIAIILYISKNMGKELNDTGKKATDSLKTTVDDAKNIQL